MLSTVTATRYVTPLREGGSLPAIVEADDFGTYVLKFRGAGQGRKALVAELVAGEIARHLDLLVPEVVLAHLAPELGRSEPDPEIQDLLKMSAGIEPGPRLPARLSRLRPARGAARLRPRLAHRLVRRPGDQRGPHPAQHEPPCLAQPSLAHRPWGFAVLPSQLAGEGRYDPGGREPASVRGRQGPRAASLRRLRRRGRCGVGAAAHP